MTAREAFWDTVLLSWLLLVFMQGLATTNGQGVLLKLNGVRLRNDSLVDIDHIPDEDLVNIGFDVARSTGLTCATDLAGCCLNPRRGEWYHPDGSLVTFDDGVAKFRRNSDQQRRTNLWRSGNPMQRGRFHCELPDAGMINQIRYYVNILLDIGAVSVSPAGITTRTVGENFNLQCSVDITPNPLPENVPTPSFEWFFGSNNVSLPSDVTVSSLTNSGNTYTSTLQFSPLQESHAGMYTCRLGGNARLANNEIITVNRPSITVIVTQDRDPELGSVYILNCALAGTERLSPIKTYQWTKANETSEAQVGTNSSTLSFSPLCLSDAGRYTCNVTVSSPYLYSDILASAGNSQAVMFQIPNPTVSISSNPPSPILDGTDVTLTCIVTMGLGVSPSDLRLLIVDTQLSRDGTTLGLTGPVVSGTTFTYTIQLDSFGRNDSGNYVCTATVRPQQHSTYLTGIGVQSNTIIIVNITPVVPSPLNVQASQSSASNSVEVSWSLPSGGAALIITGYRIFYGNQENVSVAPIFTGVALNISKDAVGEMVSIRSEADQLTSKLINVTITDDLTKSCSTEVSVAVGSTILLMLCVAQVMAITLVCCWRKEKTNKSSTDLSGNMTQSVYEEPDKLASSGQENYELTQCLAYESTTSKPQPGTTNRSSE